MKQVGKRTVREIKHLSDVLLFKRRGQISSQTWGRVAWKCLGAGDLIECWWWITWQALSASISPPSGRSLFGPFYKYGNQRSRSRRPSAARTKGQSYSPALSLTLSGCHRGPHLRRAPPQPWYLSSLPVPHCPFMPTLFLAFGMWPHLQWRVRRSKKPHIAPMQKAWLR